MTRAIPFPTLISISALVVAACSSTTSGSNGQQTASAIKCTADDQCASGKERCDVARGACVKLEVGVELGKGDGTPSSVTFSEIYVAQKPPDFVDLAFNADSPTQLWALGYGDDSVHIGTGVSGTDKGAWQRLRDPAAIHFMHKPPAIAWGANGFWATCGDTGNEANDETGRQQPNFFMGPALFTSDLTVFAKQTGEKLGSHYDMLHNTSYCRGIAHVEDNWFWVFNSELGSLDKYNFAKDHGPGADDHSDGEIYRYAEGQVKGLEGVPSHLAYDANDGFLYVADTGNKRIVRLDTKSGTLGARLPRRNEPLAKDGIMEGTSVEVVVAAGTLEEPCGLEVRNDHLYVSDAKTSTFHVFDKQGKEVRKLATGLPERSLAGFTFSRDNKLFFVDRKRSAVMRIDVP